MNAGLLDRRMIIYTRSTTAGEFGTHYSVSWTQHLSGIPCSKLLQGGNESYSSEGRQTEQRAKFIIRYRTDLNTKMECEVDGIRYGIVHIEESKGVRKMYLDLFVEAKI